MCLKLLPQLLCYINLNEIEWGNLILSIVTTCGLEVFSSQSVIVHVIHLIMITECVSWKSIQECEMNSGDIRGCNVQEAFDVKYVNMFYPITIHTIVNPLILQ